jgi:hypothetical protein
MHTVCNVLKRDVNDAAMPPPGLRPGGGIAKDFEEDRKRLKSSLKEAEQKRLFEEFKVKDVQKDVQARDAVIAEKEKQIAALLPLHQENAALRKRVEDLQASLLQAAKTMRELELRLTRQAGESADAHQKRMETARTAAMNTINEHVQALQLLFQKHTDPRTREEVLADFVTHTDAVRTAVAINLI